MQTARYHNHGLTPLAARKLCLHIYGTRDQNLALLNIASWTGADKLRDPDLICSKTMFKLSRLLKLSLSIAALLLSTSPHANTPMAQSAPVAAKKPKDVTLHGDTRFDDYFWLRDKDNAEVQAYLKAEAAYSAQYFEPLDGFKDALYNEMLGRIKQTDDAVPYRNGQWWYTSRQIEGKQYPVHLRWAAQGSERALDTKQAEQVVLDVNQLSEGKKFMSVRGPSVSPDGHRIAYATDETGARDYTLFARDLKTQKALPVKIEKTAGFTWAADNKTLFYITMDAAKRSNKLWRHEIGQKRADALVYEEKDELFSIEIGGTRDHRYVVLTSGSKDTSEVRLIDAAKPSSAARIVLPRKKEQEYSLDHHDGKLYVRINDTGRNFRLVTMDANKPDLSTAKEIVAHRKNVMLEDIDTFKDFFVLKERDDGSVKLRIFDTKTMQDHHVAFDETVYSTNGTANAEFDTKNYRFVFNSLATPASVYDYNPATRNKALMKVQPVLGGYDATRYQSERHYATAKDGTRIPISIVYRKDMKRSGSQPTLLEGYGSYGYPFDPSFSSSRVSLLDRGVVYAIAHIRGGGDLGQLWYDDGKLDKKMNTFTDFIAVADALVEKKIASPEHLIIHGGSAGGLLMGAVTNLRPELFKAVVSEVPFVDVINTMTDETLPLTVGEFLEWGNPKIKVQYDWMRAYSPYENLKRGAYPAMFIRTGLNDSQVSYWEPAKYAAKLRTLKTDSNPLLFAINMDAGHGGASGRYDALKEAAMMYTFMLQQWGLTSPATGKTSQ
jgi:oligopeptidase B